jgi:hypothetical protein
MVSGRFPGEVHFVRKGFSYPVIIFAKYIPLWIPFAAGMHECAARLRRVRGATAQESEEASREIRLR